MIGEWIKRGKGKTGSPRSTGTYLKALLAYINRPDKYPDPDAVHEGRDERVVARGAINMTEDSQEAQLAEMLATISEAGSASGRSLLRHYVLSYARDEHPTNAEADQTVRAFLREMGFEEHQAAWARHSDTENDHLHIVVSRVHPWCGRVRSIGMEQYAVHRAVARVNHHLGRVDTENSIYTVNADGVLIERSDGLPAGPMAPRRAAQRTSKHELEREITTGLASAQRQAREQVLPALQAVLAQPDASWESFHRAVGAAGAIYEHSKVYVGARLRFPAADGDEDRIVSAGRVDKSIALKDLVARLGPYRPAGADTITAAAAPAIMPGVDATAVAAAREAGDDVKRLKTEKAEARRRQAAVITEIKEDIKARRRALHLSDAGAWTGRGKERNRLAKQLGDEQKKRIAEIYSLNKDKLKLLNEELLIAQASASITAHQRRGRFAPGSVAALQAALHDLEVDIDGFVKMRRPAQPGAASSRTVDYWRDGWGAYRIRPDFSETVDSVDVLRPDSDGVILAAMRVALEKFGEPLTVEGTREFMKRAAELAGQHGVEIKNPELQHHWRAGATVGAIADVGGEGDGERGAAEGAAPDSAGKASAAAVALVTAPRSPSYANEWMNMFEAGQPGRLAAGSELAPPTRRLARHVYEIIGDEQIRSKRTAPDLVLSEAAARMAATGHDSGIIQGAITQLAEEMVEHQGDELTRLVKRTAAYAVAPKTQARFAQAPLERLLQVEGRPISALATDRALVSAPAPNVPGTPPVRPAIPTVLEPVAMPEAPQDAMDGDPLIAWAKREIAPILEQALAEQWSWEKVHEKTTEHRFVVAEAGAGLAGYIVDPAGKRLTSIKLSDTSRRFSKMWLEARLKAYVRPAPAVLVAKTSATVIALQPGQSLIDRSAVDPIAIAARTKAPGTRDGF